MTVIVKSWYVLLFIFFSEIFPYLVVVIGLENILVVTKSVVSTPVHLDVKIRVAQGILQLSRYFTVVVEFPALSFLHFMLTCYYCI